MRRARLGSAVLVVSGALVAGCGEPDGSSFGAPPGHLPDAPGGGAGGRAPVTGSTGAPMGSRAHDPFTLPDVCASESFWSGEGSHDMKPGEACISCHDSGEGPHFVVAGTVFTQGHVPDSCNPTTSQKAALAQAQVFVKDASGAVLTLMVWPSGNFMQKPLAPPLVFPINAWVAAGGRERHMVAAAMSGDCNTCHTEAGASGAPGRIVLP